MVDFSEFVEAAESYPDSAYHQLGMLSSAAYNAGMRGNDPEVKAAKEKIKAIGNRSAAEKRKATIAARKARPRIIDAVSSNARQVEVLQLAVDQNIDLLAPEASKVPDAEWEEWVEAFRTAEAGMRRARLRLEALQAGEVLPECEQCGETIVGRSDARYCSTRCRVAAHRAKGKLPEAERQERASAKAREDRGQLLDNFHNEIESLVFIARNLDPKAREYIAGRFRDATADIEAE